MLIYSPVLELAYERFGWRTSLRFIAILILVVGLFGAIWHRRPKAQKTVTPADTKESSKLLTINLISSTDHSSSAKEEAGVEGGKEWGTETPLPTILVSRTNHSFSAKEDEIIIKDEAEGGKGGGTEASLATILSSPTNLLSSEKEVEDVIKEEVRAKGGMGGGTETSLATILISPTNHWSSCAKEDERVVIKENARGGGGTETPLATVLISSTNLLPSSEEEEPTIEDGNEDITVTSHATTCISPSTTPIPSTNLPSHTKDRGAGCDEGTDGGAETPPVKLDKARLARDRQRKSRENYTQLLKDPVHWIFCLATMLSNVVMVFNVINLVSLNVMAGVIKRVY